MPLIPFDISRFAPASLADVPVISHVAGLIGLFVSDSGQFSYLTANAYNAWALVGDHTLASIVGGAGGTWTADSLLVVGGLQAVTLGALLLAGAGLFVAIGLLIRADRLAIILGFTLTAVAFYILPTRVHERYLFPAFGSGALLAAAAARWAWGYFGLGLLNTINLHAVLAGGLRVGSGGLGTGGGGGAFGGAGGAAGAGGGGFTPGGGVGPTGGFGAGGGFGGGGAGGAGGASSISLPFADLARSEPVVIAVALGQTLVFVGLLVAWLAVILGPHAIGRNPAERSIAESEPVSEYAHGQEADSMRVLVAEDDPGLRDVISLGLRDAGYQVDAVDRGDDAIDQLQWYDYDVAIIDWRMPGAEGIDVVAWARRNGKPTALLMLTARDAPADRIHGLDTGADDYLVKPFDFGELLARVRALQRRPRGDRRAGPREGRRGPRPGQPGRDRRPAGRST